MHYSNKNVIQKKDKTHMKNKSIAVNLNVRVVMKNKSLYTLDELFNLNYERLIESLIIGKQRNCKSSPITFLFTALSK